MTTYYHGTTVLRSVGDYLTPDHEIGVGRGQTRHAYFTSSILAAHGYAHAKAAAQLAIHTSDQPYPVPVVYQIELPCRYEPDPTVDERFQAFRTTESLRIIGRVPSDVFRGLVPVDMS